MTHRKIITFFISMLFAGCALPVFAMTQAETNALVSQILAQIAAIQAQISILEGQQTPSPTATNTSWCYTFNTGLGYVNSGASEVAHLHTALQRENISYSPDGINSYTSATGNAVLQFQAKYGILQTGYVGPLTRAKLNKLYGCQPNPISLIYPNGGQTVRLGDVVRITWNATGVSLTDKVTIDVYTPSDPYLNVKTITKTVSAIQGYYDWNVSTATLPSTSYPVNIRVKVAVNGKDISVSSASDIMVNSLTDNNIGATIALTYPGGGQVLRVGDSSRIAWSSTGLSSFDKVTITVYSPANPNSNVKTITTSTPATQGYFDWNVSATTLPSTSYPILVRVKVSVNGKSIFASSASDVTVNSATNQGLASISVVYPNGGEVLRIGDTLRVTWTTNGFSSTDRLAITAYLPSTPYLNPRTLTTTVSATQGYYDWKITKYLSSTSYPAQMKIKVESTSKNLSSSSVGSFTVSDPSADDGAAAN